MKRFKKALRVLCLVLLILLASVGAGISGGVPVRSSHKEDQVQEAVSEGAEREAE